MSVVITWSAVYTQRLGKATNEPSLFHFDSFEQHRKIRASDAHVVAADRRGPLERPLLQSLVVHPKSVAVPLDQLDAIVPAVEKDVDVSAQRILLQRVAHDP